MSCFNLYCKGCAVGMSCFIWGRAFIVLFPEWIHQLSRIQKWYECIILNDDLWGKAIVSTSWPVLKNCFHFHSFEIGHLITQNILTTPFYVLNNRLVAFWVIGAVLLSFRYFWNVYFWENYLVILDDRQIENGYHKSMNDEIIFTRCSKFHLSIY